MALDDADKKVISDLIVAALKPETIGAAVKAHLDGLKLDEVVAAKVKDATKDLVKPEASDKADKDADKGKGKDDPRVAALEAKFEQERAAREASEKARARDQLETAAREALVKSGVPADRVKHALAVLKTEGTLDFGADGKGGWKGKDRYGVDALLTPEEGAAAWVKSDDGKHFLPPVQTRGSGEKPGSASPVLNGKGEINLDAIGDSIGRALAQL